MVEIYIIGTTHISNKSKLIIETAFKQNNFDCVMSEGVNGRIYNEVNWVKEPFLTLIALIYSFFLMRFGKDIVIVEDLSKKYNIPTTPVTVTPSRF